MPSYKYSLLNNKEWLIEQYVSCQRNTTEIANMVGAKSGNSVRQALIRNEIEVRNQRESTDLSKVANTDNFNLNDLSKQVIEGSLLGDASLCVYNIRSENSYPYFKKKNKYYQHVLYVADSIFLQDGASRISKDLDTRHDTHYYTVRSLSHLELLPLLRDWYPEYNNYKKVIPESLEVTPLVLLNWFLDDGHARIRNRNDYKPHWRNNKKQVIITMCTESFSKTDQEMLSEKIKRSFGLRFSIVKCNFGTGWRMILSQAQTTEFYNIIGTSPVGDLNYKWK